MTDKTTNDSHDTFVVNIKHEWHKLRELKTLEEVLRVFNALEISFMSDKVEKYNLHDLIETSPQDTPAIEINPNPKGIDVWKELYDRYRLEEKERRKGKDYNHYI